MKFRPDEILKTLVERQVVFVVVGGIAAAAHGSPYPTRDLDICPQDDDGNLTRLGEALQELEARLLVTDEPEPIQVNLSPLVLRSSDFLTFATRWGVVDIIRRPAGTRGYEDLHRQAVRVSVAGVDIKLASLEDIVRSKAALLRDKDLKTLQVLRELAERRIQEGRGRPGTED